MDVDVVPGRIVLDVLDQGSIHVLRASAKRGCTGWVIRARVEEGHNDRTGDASGAFVDMGGKGRSGQACNRDYPAHFALARVQRHHGGPASVPGQGSGKWITPVKRIGKPLGGNPARNARSR